MKDIKTLTVHPDLENNAINFWQDFGYELSSSQEIFSQGFRLEQSGIDYLMDGITSVTTTVHYVKLIFERDHSIPHYQELKELEDQFNAVPHPGARDRKYSAYEIFMGFMFCTVPGVVRLMHNLNLDRTAGSYANALNECHTRQRQIREKAAAIVRS